MKNEKCCRDARILKVQRILSYEFSDINNILLALTHSSYAYQDKSNLMKSNERLEFLGDSILNFIVSDFIYSKFPELSEGNMSKMRSNVVCEAFLAERAMSLGLGECLLLGKGEELTGGRNRPSILCDVFEAVIGALYLDGGLDVCRKLILENISDKITSTITNGQIYDYKTKLQEFIQKEVGHRIEYNLMAESGPDHDKLFVVRVNVDGQEAGIGRGKSKKEAEQEAAKMALGLMG